MESRIRDIEEVLVDAIEAAEMACYATEVEFLAVKYLGRKGFVTKVLRSISSLPANERPKAGKRANEVSALVRAALNKAMARIEGAGEKNEDDVFDVTLPGRKRNVGHLHPITKIVSQICCIFSKMGFDVIEGPEVETDYYNFEALNMPKNHPARDMQDTFYVSDGFVLRTHTSSTQPRIMEQQDPPIHVIAPGKVYRCDFDVTHTPMFHQVEGLLVDCGVTFGDLKGIISVFIHEMFGKQTKMRFRPSFFPFTEPSAEVDIVCVICTGRGCRVCSHTGWLEVMGSGMVHPAVFKKVDYDTTKYTGLAFGVGVERIAMLKYRIDDIRKCFDNDFRFLSQF